LSFRILHGEALEELRKLPDESVHCCVTSPPYWGLRDYGVPGQIGLEGTPEEYVEKLVTVFEEVRRVLRDDGTLWLNLGDSYWNGGAEKRDGGHDFVDGGKSKLLAAKGSLLQCRSSTRLGLKPKDLVGTPWRVAFALQAAGWWLRSDIIWAKPNPMPESVTDRPTKAHEYVFLLAKSERYYFDQEAIRERSAFPAGPNAPDAIKSPYGQGFTRRAGLTGGAYALPGQSPHGNARTEKAIARENGKGVYRPNGESGGVRPVAPFRNIRSVWTIATEPFPEAHFATFPTELARRCILAGCPKGGTALDPFAGAGTVGLVADRLGRQSISIELNPAYVEMAWRRIVADAPLFNQTISEPSPNA